MSYKDRLLQKYRLKIRERAILQAKSRIALSGRQMQDFSEDELEVIVLDEERKVKSSLRQSGVVVLLIIFGLN